jgi:hypothetical protein
MKSRPSPEGVPSYPTKYIYIHIKSVPAHRRRVTHISNDEIYIAIHTTELGIIFPRPNLRIRGEFEDAIADEEFEWL